MALWPFRRKSRSRRRPDELRGRQSEPILSARNPIDPNVAGGYNSMPSTQGKPRRQPTEPNKLQRRTRTYRRRQKGSLSQQRSNTDGYPAGPSNHGKECGDKEVGGSRSTSEGAFTRVPTLHNKRDAQHLMPRKKSSKRRKNDHDREAEIKAMSDFVPVRPATDEWTAGRPIRKDTRRVYTGLGFGYRRSSRNEWDKENRGSDISPHLADSIRSGMSTDSEGVSWKVSALEALAPRPTLQYTIYPRYAGGHGSDSSGPAPARKPSQRRKLSEREPIPESTLKAHKRIDDLADDLDASDLRELMERDQRRRERKQQIEQERVARRLARRAEKAKAAEAGVTEGQPVQNLERGVLGREDVGLGLDPASAVVTSSRMRPSSHTSLTGSNKETEAPADDEMRPESRPQPLDTFHRTTSLQLETPVSLQETHEPVPALTRSSRQYGNLRPRKSRSKSPLAQEDRAETPETWRKGSETSSSKGPLSWMSLFRWSKQNPRRNSDGPSSFSNTSRETMQTSQLSTPVPPVNYVAQQKHNSGVPRRTMSRFREDLPETTPLSPSASRVQSPEDQAFPTTIAEMSPDIGRESQRLPTPPPEVIDIPGSRSSHHASVEAMRETPSTFSRLDETRPSPEPNAMSLASVDSEASWLSGRVSGRRRSSAVKTQHPYRYSPPQPDTSPVANEASPGEDSIADDEYLSRFTPSQEPSGWNRKSIGEARPSSDGEEEGPRWGSVRGHVPTLVQGPRVNTVKSREGLMNTFGEETDVRAESDDDGDLDEASPSIIETPLEVQRAKSVNLGKGHVRNFSAGSAKLLDLTPRTSVDAKRRSVEPRL
ncbi:hypothetical protein DL546_008739 [Coniochaeta pulveracea]|uniref:Uncharacterized protein n=1 Tax=Coniochaeta pulveracea TaxID=177199 RepID=A0A420YLZ0_9PEZI|nr:hypothetical protein DL546_008739 [Coniochaeta pulveracea]